MNDASDTRGTPGPGLALMGFALGAVVGAGIALLLSPDSGKRTRQRLASTARRWSDNAGHTIDEARDTVAGLGADAKSAIKAGQDAFQHDRATRDARTERRLSRAGEPAPGGNAVSSSGEEAVR